MWEEGGKYFFKMTLHFSLLAKSSFPLRSTVIIKKKGLSLSFLRVFAFEKDFI
jgi:hypothetical protein